MYQLMQNNFEESYDNKDFEDVTDTIEGERFNRLINICFNVASYFSLTIAPWTACTKTELEKKLEPFLVKKLHVHKWFCYDLSSSDRYLDVYIYKAIPSTKDILLKYFVEVLLREPMNNTMIEGTQTLEYLCVFTEKSFILGTVTHEEMCYFYPPNEKVEREILTLGSWKYRDYDSSPQIDFEEILSNLITIKTHRKRTLFRNFVVEQSSFSSFLSIRFPK